MEDKLLSARQNPVQDQDNDARFDALMNLAAQIVWSTDASGRVLFVNHHWTDYTSLSLEQTQAVGWLGVVHPEDCERAQKAWATARAAENFFEIESRFQARDGSYRYHLVRAVAVRDASGAIAHWLCIGLDIQDLKDAKAALQVSQEQLQVVVQGAGIATWKWDPIGDRILYHHNVDTMYGLSEPLQSYAQLKPYIHPDDLPHNIEAIARSMATGENLQMEYRVCRPDGATIWVAAIASLLRGENGTLAFAGIKMDITARKQAEEKLRDNEARYKALAEAGAQFVWINRADGYTTYVNPQWAAYTGLSQEETTGAGWAKVLHPDDRERVRASHREALATGTVHETQLRYRRASDGAYRWFIIRSTPLRDEKGAIQNWLGVAVDIHAQKEAETALRISEERFRLASEAMRGMVYEWDVPTGRVLHSQGIFDLIGIHPHQVPANLDWWRQRVHPGDQEKIDRPSKAALESQSPLYNAEYRVRHEDGHYVWIWDSSSLVYDEKGHLARMVGCAISIDKRKKAEEAVRESEMRFRTMADTAPVLIWMADLDKNCYYFNKTWLDFTGRTTEEEAGNNWTSGVHPDDLARCLEIYGVSFDARREFKMEYRLRRYDGRYRWLLGHGVPRYTPNGEFLGYIGSCIDIEERKKAEAENERLLQEAQEANRLKDEFLAIVSHELRTPLNAILGWSHLCNAGTIRPEEIPHALKIIERNARAQAQIVEDILDMARVITGKMRIEILPVSLESVAREVLESVRPAAEAKNIMLRASFEPELPLLPADEGRLRQIVWNLLSNAIKFTPEQGEVALFISRDHHQIHLVISDTGQGIEADFLPFVFDRFRQADGGTTRRHGGLGIGLSLARHLVEAHGGSIQVASKGSGQGAAFTVSLPLRTVKQQSLAAGQPQKLSEQGLANTAPSPRNKKLRDVRILVIDDAPDTMQLIASLLNKEGALLQTASSATEARTQIGEQTPDLVLCDLGMPDEDGYAFMAWLREWTAQAPCSVPAVALTACASIDERTRALGAGFVAFVPKPIEASELLATLTLVLNR